MFPSSEGRTFAFFVLWPWEEAVEGDEGSRGRQAQTHRTGRTYPKASLGAGVVLVPASAEQAQNFGTQGNGSETYNAGAVTNGETDCSRRQFKVAKSHTLAQKHLCFLWYRVRLQRPTSAGSSEDKAGSQQGFISASEVLLVCWHCSPEVSHSLFVCVCRQDSSWQHRARLQWWPVSQEVSTFPGGCCSGEGTAAWHLKNRLKGQIGGPV